MKVTTIASFPDRSKTESIVHELRARGIEDEQISSVYLDSTGSIKDEQTEQKIEGGAMKGATTGGIVGAIAGLVVANGFLPGLGSVFVAGPLLTNLFGLGGAVATALGGTVTGAVAGGLIGALTNLGVSEEDAQIYQDRLIKGDVVMITRTEHSVAKKVFEDNDATDVKEYMENED